MSEEQDVSSLEDGEQASGTELPIPHALLNNLSNEKRAEIIEYVSQVSIARHFSGPLPPPDMLNQYGSEVQSAIVDEAVEHRRHRNMFQIRRQAMGFVWDILTLVCAFALAFRLVDGSIHVILQGKSIEGLLGIGGTVSLIAGAFLFRHRSRRRSD